MIQCGRINTPIGPLEVFAKDGALVFIDLQGGTPSARALVQRRFPAEEIQPANNPGACLGALQRYFAGDLTALDTLAVNPGGTPFQSTVWRALRSIRPGTPISYSALASRIGSPHAVRAVGAANGANPIPIVIPCHRVIGASGKLVGYGGGLERKTWLLRHEGWRSLLD